MDNHFHFSHDWQVYSLPDPPLIHASIETELWNITTNTVADSRLTVFANSTLILICFAKYPVFWRKDEEALISQDYCYTLDADQGVCSNSSAHIWPKSDFTEICPADSNCTSINFRNQSIWLIPAAAAQYRTTITLHNVTTGKYICNGSQIQIGTAVLIDIRPEPDDSRPRLLQGGFEEIAYFSEPSPEIMMIHQQEVRPVSFIYFSPQNTLLRPYLYGDYDLYFSALERDPYPVFEIGNHMYNYSSLLVSQPVSARIVKATFMPNVDNRVNTIRYQFVVKDESEMEVINENFQVVITDPHIEPISVNSLNSHIENSIVLAQEQLFSIYFLTENSQDAWLEVNEAEPVYKAGEHCKYKESTKESAERCGVISVTSRIISDIRKAYHWKVREVLLILNATRPCKFIILWKNGDGNSYLINDSALYVAVAEHSYFQPYVPVPALGDVTKSDFGYVSIRSIPASNTPCTTEVYVNQSFDLECLFPVCQPHMMIRWCQKAAGTFCGMRGFDPTEDWTGNHEKLDFCTVVSRLTFPSSKQEQAGSYKCAVVDDSAMFTPLFHGIFHVIVSDPIPPLFDDNKGYGPIDEVLSPNHTLICPVRGRPEPIISWSCSQEGRDVDCPASTKLSHGSSMEVNQAGVYKCTANNGYGNMTSRKYNVQNPPVSKSTTGIHWSIYLIGGLVLVATLLTIMVLLIDRWRRNRRMDGYFKELADILNSAQPFQLDTSAPLNDQASLLPYDRNFEIDRNAFTIRGKLLGEGEFGYIYKGVVNSFEGQETAERKTVAVKLPKDPSNHHHYGSLLDELRIMCHIRPHVNVLSLIGACTTAIERRQLFVLTEFCEHGSLRDYLVENRRHFEDIEEQRSVESLLKFAYQAANGMIIHRDLALRNLLLTDAQIVKISDFGMSRRHESVYRKKLSPDVPIPIFWMALESLLGDQYTQKSDVSRAHVVAGALAAYDNLLSKTQEIFGTTMETRKSFTTCFFASQRFPKLLDIAVCHKRHRWSFGIVLWEMFNCGRRPYPDHEPDMAFRSWLRASEQNRLGPPKIVCEEIYHLMRECWKVDTAARPTFSQCKRQIAETLENRLRSMYLSFLRTLSDADHDMIIRQTLSGSSSACSSRISIGTSVAQCEDNRSHCSEGLNDDEAIGAGTGQIENPSQSIRESADTEAYAMTHLPQEKASAKPYVAASSAYMTHVNSPMRSSVLNSSSCDL